MKHLKLKLTGPDLPKTHPHAPWKKGATKLIIPPVAEHLMAELPGQFEAVGTAEPEAVTAVYTGSDANLKAEPATNGGGTGN